jgi:EEF1A N-terminal glycine/lysine methyltransferase
VQLAEFIEENEAWSVRGESVLEVGAGTGLAGIVAGLSGGKRVVIGDYPAPEVLGNIKANAVRNSDARRKDAQEGGIGEATVEGHERGVLDDTFSKANEGAFGKILAADCLWLPWQHTNLLNSIEWFLSREGKAWVVAGFHPGREKMRGFYKEDALREVSLEVERNAEGSEREWVTDRGIEDVAERKRWLVVAILKKKVGGSSTKEG